jgi:hypothetical protein
MEQMSHVGAKCIGGMGRALRFDLDLSGSFIHKRRSGNRSTDASKGIGAVCIKIRQSLSARAYQSIN